MRTAFISDVHGHWEGLELVLQDIKTQQIDRIICLGDMIDGGTHNNQVVDFIRIQQISSVQGNHDAVTDCELSAENKIWLKHLPEKIIEEDMLFTHISPRRKKYSVTNTIEAWNVFDETTFRLCFIGHIHFPILFGEASEEFGESHAYPADCEQHVLNPADRYIISFGAVGYPRRAGKYIRYGIFDALNNTVEFRRIEGALLPYGLGSI